MIPPPKPRRPAPDARELPRANKDLVVPGIPRQKSSETALEAAREAARASHDESRFIALHDRIDGLEARVDDMSQTHNRVADSVDGLRSKVTEWELVAAGSESVKLQEEGKTKRLTMVIGLLTVVLNAMVAIGVNVYTKAPAPAQMTPVSPTEQAAIECRDKFRTDIPAQAKCLNEIVIGLVTPPQH